MYLLHRSWRQRWNAYVGWSDYTDTPHLPMSDMPPGPITNEEIMTVRRRWPSHGLCLFSEPRHTRRRMYIARGKHVVIILDPWIEKGSWRIAGIYSTWQTLGHNPLSLHIKDHRVIDCSPWRPLFLCEQYALCLGLGRAPCRYLVKFEWFARYGAPPDTVCVGSLFSVVGVSCKIGFVRVFLPSSFPLICASFIVLIHSSFFF